MIMYVPTIMQRMGIYSLLQSPEDDHENNVGFVILYSSNATYCFTILQHESNIIYAEIDPRIVPANSVTMDTILMIPPQEERTQYAEITHHSEPLVETTIANELGGDKNN